MIDLESILLALVLTCGVLCIVGVYALVGMFILIHQIICTLGSVLHPALHRFIASVRKSNLVLHKNNR